MIIFQESTMFHIKRHKEVLFLRLLAIILMTQTLLLATPTHIILAGGLIIPHIVQAPCNLEADKAFHSLLVNQLLLVVLFNSNLVLMQKI